MTEVKKYIWVLPLVGGVIALISLLTPVVSVNLMGMITGSLWMWDLYTYNFAMVSSGTEFVMEPLVLIPSLTSTCLLVIGGILLLTTGMKLKNRNLEQVNVKVPSILAGIVILIAEILWLSMVPTFFPLQRFYSGYPGTFWTYSYMSFHTAGFGLIGGFISTFIAFGAAGAAQYYSKDREVVISDKKEKFPLTKEPTTSETSELKFCPECGAEIEDPDIKFCGKCGFDLKPPELAHL